MTDKKKPSESGEASSKDADKGAPARKTSSEKKAAPVEKAGAKASTSPDNQQDTSSAGRKGGGAAKSGAQASTGAKAAAADTPSTAKTPKPDAAAGTAPRGAATGAMKEKPKKRSRMSIEEEKKALDAIITGDSTAEEKKAAIEKLKTLNDIDDIIKRKHHKRYGSDELKQKAHAARQSASEKILKQSYVADADMALERLADTFDKSARRWEMVVYPSLFAFVLLAGYGFYLIYHLTHDIAVLSHSVTRMATIVSDATPKVTSDMRDMSADMQDMSGELRTMSYQMETLKPMSNNIAHMTNTMGALNTSVYGMQRDMGGLNRTISGGPFGFMNDVMPFSADSYRKPPPPLPMQSAQPVYIQPMMTPPVMYQQQQQAQDSAE